MHNVLQERWDGTQPRCRDAKDDYLLLLALSVKADTLVTSDEDLLVLNPWNNVAILRSAEFLQRESGRIQRDVSSVDLP